MLDSSHIQFFFLVEIFLIYHIQIVMNTSNLLLYYIINNIENFYQTKLYFMCIFILFFVVE
jgi:hypothetical protein